MLFIENKYTRIYYKIIDRARERSIFCYTEKHHIIPKSLGGSNTQNNLVALTAREHFICHLLLTKMTERDARNKMLSAVFYLTGRGKAKERNNIIKTSRLYQRLKEDFSVYNGKMHKGRKRPPRTEETKKRLTISKTGKLNPNFKFKWITPWGVFESSRLAANACPETISDVAILNFCQKKNKIPISYLSVCRSKGWLKEEHIGKTPEQLGFAINI